MQNILSILDETELSKITTYLKGNIHVKYYIVYKLIDINNCWFVYFQHPQSIYSISPRFNSVYTLLYRGPSKNLIKFIKTNGKYLDEYGTADNLNLKSSLKRDLLENEFIEPFDIVNKTLNYINETKKKKKVETKKSAQKPEKISVIKVVSDPVKNPVQEPVKVVKSKQPIILVNPDQKVIVKPVQEPELDSDYEPDKETINNSTQKTNQEPDTKQDNKRFLETPETEIEYTDIETTDTENIKPKLNPFKENKKYPEVRVQPVSKNDISIENWKNNIHTDYKEIQVLWIYGASDVDKTDRIKRFINDNKEKYGTLINVVSFDGKYWKGVGEKARVAIYDGFKETHMAVFEYLDFVDKEIHDLPTLTGKIKNNYNLIIISSIFNPEYIYVNYNEDIREQIKKSINKIIKV